MPPSKGRTSLAALACETCRKRKSKCDEQRPKCSLCIRLNVECEYKEPAPERKDEAMVAILDTLHRLETKLDSVSLTGSATTPRSTLVSSGPPTQSPFSDVPTRKLESETTMGKDTSRYQRQRQPTSPYLTVPYRIMLWPNILSQLVNLGSQAQTELELLSKGGTAWLVKLETAKSQEKLPNAAALPSYIPNIGINETSKYSLRVSFPTLTVQKMQTYSNAYFNTFNVLHPILDYNEFVYTTLQPLLTSGFAYGDASSVLALLVFALGQLAIEGVTGSPISSIGETSSGIRGGTARSPPGLDIFNEARARVGSIALRSDLVDVQVLFLQATYFEASACHVEYWRTTVAASMACLVLVQSPEIQWSTPRGDLIKRAYWSCVMHEDLYHLELDLPRTAIHEYEDVVPFPHFYEAGQDTEPYSRNLGYCFLARIALHKIITRIHEAVHLRPTQSESTEDYVGPPARLIRELAHQLETWRSTLPKSLQWSDNDFMNTLDTGNVTIHHTDQQFGLDMLTTELRTRFYYGRYILFRPYIFKALHYPQSMNMHDVECCEFAIKSTCLWPVAMEPSKSRKRLTPHAFAWTQNFIGILLILRMLQDNERLSQFYMERLDADEIQQTTSLLLEWIVDIKQIDGIADWSWGILEPFFSQRTYVPS